MCGLAISDLDQSTPQQYVRAVIREAADTMDRADAIIDTKATKPRWGVRSRIKTEGVCCRVDRQQTCDAASVFIAIHSHRTSLSARTTTLIWADLLYGW